MKLYTLLLAGLMLLINPIYSAQAQEIQKVSKVNTLAELALRTKLNDLIKCAANITEENLSQFRTKLDESLEYIFIFAPKRVQRLLNISLTNDQTIKMMFEAHAISSQDYVFCHTMRALQRIANNTFNIESFYGIKKIDSPEKFTILNESILNCLKFENETEDEDRKSLEMLTNLTINIWTNHSKELSMSILMLFLLIHSNLKSDSILETQKIINGAIKLLINNTDGNINACDAIGSSVLKYAIKSAWFTNDTSHLKSLMLRPDLKIDKKSQVIISMLKISDPIVLKKLIRMLIIGSNIFIAVKIIALNIIALAPASSNSTLALLFGFAIPLYIEAVDCLLINSNLLDRRWID